jgi:hypothetical protein
MPDEGRKWMEASYRFQTKTSARLRLISSVYPLEVEIEILEIGRFACRAREASFC